METLRAFLGWVEIGVAVLLLAALAVVAVVWVGIGTRAAVAAVREAMTDHARFVALLNSVMLVLITGLVLIVVGRLFGV